MSLHDPIVGNLHHVAIIDTHCQFFSSKGIIEHLSRYGIEMGPIDYQATPTLKIFGIGKYKSNLVILEALTSFKAMKQSAHKYFVASISKQLRFGQEVLIIDFRTTDTVPSESLSSIASTGDIK